MACVALDFQQSRQATRHAVIKLNRRFRRPWCLDQMTKPSLFRYSGFFPGFAHGTRFLRDRKERDRLTRHSVGSKRLQRLCFLVRSPFFPQKVACWIFEWTVILLSLLNRIIYYRPRVSHLKRLEVFPCLCFISESNWQFYRVVLVKKLSGHFLCVDRERGLDCSFSRCLKNISGPFPPLDENERSVPRIWREVTWEASLRA